MGRGKQFLSNRGGLNVMSKASGNYASVFCIMVNVLPCLRKVVLLTGSFCLRALMLTKSDQFLLIIQKFFTSPLQFNTSYSTTESSISCLLAGTDFLLIEGDCSSSSSYQASKWLYSDDILIQKVQELIESGIGILSPEAKFLIIEELENLICTS